MKYPVKQFFILREFSFSQGTPVFAKNYRMQVEMRKKKNARTCW